MLWFNAEKGFGFICTVDDERLYVAEAGFSPGESPRGRCAGREVVFDLSVSGDERKAVNVRFPAKADARRARRRHGTRPR
jgi:cold shock CspA family protein